MLNSQIQIHGILGFGATSTKKEEARRETNRPGKPGKAPTPGKEVGRIIQNFFFGTRNSYTITSYVSTHREVLNRCSSAAALYASSSCLQCGNAVAELLLCSKSSSRLLLIFYGNFVFISTSVIITQSLCNFLLTEPIFSSLWQC